MEMALHGPRGPVAVRRGPGAHMIGVGRIKGWFGKGPGRFARTGFAESTLAELAWQRVRNAAHRWAGTGALIGALAGLVAFAPAAWLATRVESATGGRLLLADARGTVWSGSALPVLTGGAGSRDAAALPGRLDWRLGLARPGASSCALRQACCLNGERRAAAAARAAAASRSTLLPPQAPASASGRRPGSAASARRGTRCSSAALLRLTSPGLTLESVQGRWRVLGRRRRSIVARCLVAPVDAADARQLPPHAARRRRQRRRVAAHADHARRRAAADRQRPVDRRGVRFRGEARAAPRQRGGA